MTHPNASTSPEGSDGLRGLAQRRYLIVGGSAAGMAAAVRIRELDRKGKITIISEEKDPPYYRPMIPFCISGARQEPEIRMLGTGPYRVPDLDLRLDTRATGLDPAHHMLFLEDGSNLRYDRLLIATGSRPWLPNDIDNLDSPGVFSLRSLEDARGIGQRATSTTRVVMLGGGMLNLKTAFGLLELGIEVVLAVRSPEILSQLMEQEDAGLIRRALENSGLAIMTGVRCSKILTDDTGVCGVELEGGGSIDRLDCQMVCIGKGVRPNIEWLDGSGITLDQGVVTDRYTRTSYQDIYGAGDVAVSYDPITGRPMRTGLWTNAAEMGRCAGGNMAGSQTVYGGTFGILNATQVARMPFVCMGLVHTEGTNHLIDRKNSDNSYRKLVFSSDGERLVGAVFVGDISRAGLYRTVIREKLPVKPLMDALRNQTLHYGDLLYR